MNYSLVAAVKEGAYGFRAWINERYDAKWHRDPFGVQPLASAEAYQALFEEARRKHYPEADAIEAETGFMIDREWLDNLALHTQIVKKRSDLAYPHGRLLYSVLRKYIADSGEKFVSVIETGTARGFSALCMAKAIEDAGIDGRIATLDVLPHLTRQYWNCIDDHDGKKTRAELLAPWSALLRKITFVQGDTLMMLPRIGFDRVNFAFLDAQHIYRSVMHEYKSVAPKQTTGDVIFFDDVTPGSFAGVVQAVQEIETSRAYSIRRLTISEERSYAWGHRN